MPWTLTVRNGPRVQRERHESLEAALDALDARVAELRGGARRPGRKVLGREYPAAAQVAARLEIAGPQRFLAAVRGGIDLRGDGSAVAWTGRTRRTAIEEGRGEDAAGALRRTLTA